MNLLQCGDLCLLGPFPLLAATHVSLNCRLLLGWKPLTEEERFTATKILGDPHSNVPETCVCLYSSVALALLAVIQPAHCQNSLLSKTHLHKQIKYKE